MTALVSLFDTAVRLACIASWIVVLAAMLAPLLVAIVTLG